MRRCFPNGVESATLWPVRAFVASFTVHLPRKRTLKDAPDSWGSVRLSDGEGNMAGLAMVLFISLFAFGAQYFGWDDPSGHVQIALVACFISGIVCGTKFRG